MDINKKKAFNQKMGKGKFPRHQNLAQGGMVKHFDSGGVATNAVAPGVTDAVNPGIVPNASGPQGFTGAISNFLGTNNNFQASGANIQPGTNAAQLNNAYTGANNAINAQVGLTNTLVPQAAQGVGNQSALANQYLAMTQGQGPNPAQAQLAQATGQNVANQAALMAGQRGASSNAGLIARQAAQQGAATQQQAVGQAATLGAEQQIAAQQNLANLSANQIGQAGQATTALNTAQQNEQNSLQSANTGYNNALVGEQSNINNVNAQTAAANQNQNSGILGGITGALSNIPVVGSLFKNKGGEIEKLAGGGEIQQNPLVSAPAASAPAANWAGQYLAPSAAGNPSIQGTSSLPENTTDLHSATQKKSQSGGGGVSSVLSDLGPISDFASFAATGGDVKSDQIGNNPVYHSKYFHEYFAGGGMSGRGVDAIVSPKEVYLNPKQVKEVMERGADPMRIGHHFPGKDRVKKDSLKNDVIKTKLEEGGVVLPIHITTHKDASHRGRKFVERTVAKHMKRPSGV